jgi:hypothetical protein
MDAGSTRGEAKEGEGGQSETQRPGRRGMKAPGRRCLRQG